MAIATSTIALIALAAGTVSAVEASGARSRAADNQRKIQSEQKAQNASQRAQERRNQVREERVRRGRVLQSSEASGTAGGSGEFGALGALGTNLSANIGTNVGAAATGERISGFAQAAADATGQAQNADAMFNFSANIFSQAGGFQALSGGTPSPSIFQTEATRTGRLPGTS